MGGERESQCGKDIKSLKSAQSEKTTNSLTMWASQGEAPLRPFSAALCPLYMP